MAIFSHPERTVVGLNEPLPGELGAASGTGTSRGASSDSSTTSATVTRTGTSSSPSFRVSCVCDCVCVGVAGCFPSSVVACLPLPCVQGGAPTQRESAEGGDPLSSGRHLRPTGGPRSPAVLRPPSSEDDLFRLRTRGKWTGKSYSFTIRFKETQFETVVEVLEAEEGGTEGEDHNGDRAGSSHPTSSTSSFAGLPTGQTEKMPCIRPKSAKKCHRNFKKCHKSATPNICILLYIY